MLVRTALVTPFMQNARVLIDEQTLEAVVVDPGGDIEKIAGLLSYKGKPVAVKEILLTHAHLDHAGGVNKMRSWAESQNSSKVPLLAHRAEAEMRKRVSESAAIFGLSPDDFQNVPEPERYLEEGDTVTVGSQTGRVLFTPGHSPGHISIYFENSGATLEKWEGQPKDVVLNGPFVLGGDLIFQGSIGRTNLPGGDMDILLRSVREKIFVLPDETLVLSGHGGNTTVGAEKATNPFFS